MMFAAPISGMQNGAPVLGAASVSPAAIAATTQTQNIAYYSAVATNANSALLNQRRPAMPIANQSTGGSVIGSASIVPTATLSSSGLQPASTTPVTREFGYSSAFVTQWLNQSNSADAQSILAMPGYRNMALPSPLAMAAFAEIKFMPSRASIPQPVGAMEAVVTGPEPVMHVATQQPVVQQLARQEAPTPTPGDVLLASPAPIQYQAAQVAAPTPVRQPVEALAIQAKVMMHEAEPAPVAEAPKASPARGAQQYLAVAARAAAAAKPAANTDVPVEAVQLEARAS